MYLHVSMAFIIKERDKIAEELGISSKANKISTTFDIIKALACRFEYLEDKGLLTPCVDDPDCLLVQLLADASQIFRAKNTNATAILLKHIYGDSDLTEEDANCVSNQFNLVLSTLNMNNDFYTNLVNHASSIAQQIEALRVNVIVVNGKHWRLKIPVGGDMKLLSAMMGLCGCSSEWPCMFCKAPTGSFFKHKEDWLEGLPLRNLEEHLQMQHNPSKGKNDRVAMYDPFYVEASV